VKQRERERGNGTLVLVCLYQSDAFLDFFSCSPLSFPWTFSSITCILSCHVAIAYVIAAFAAAAGTAVFVFIDDLAAIASTVCVCSVHSVEYRMVSLESKILEENGDKGDLLMGVEDH
jgi:hypothetical protein